MEVVVERLARWLWSNRPGALDALAPGVGDDALTACEKQLGATLPAGLRALYRWRNGNAADRYEAILGRWALTPLEQVVAHQALMNGLVDQGAFKTSNWWRKTWVPFADDGCGNHLCWDPRGSFSGSKGQVLEFWHTDHDRKVLAPSFDDYLTIYVDSLEAGLWQYDEEQGLIEDGFESFIGARCKGYPHRAIDFDGKRPSKPPPPPPAIAADLERPVKIYAASTKFEVADQVTHPQFGTGVVQFADDSKIEVLFATERRTLVHGRGASASLGRPPKIDHTFTRPKF